jgi:hypothetical protein
VPGIPKFSSLILLSDLSELVEGTSCPFLVLDPFDLRQSTKAHGASLAITHSDTLGSNLAGLTPEKASCIVGTLGPRTLESRVEESFFDTFEFNVGCDENFKKLRLGNYLELTQKKVFCLFLCWC